MFRYELHGRLLGSNLGGPAHPPKVDYNRFPGFPFRLEGKTRGEPADLLLLSPYDLIIHCGACMFNRRHVIHRIAQANAQGIPISNYGVVLAYLTGILDQVSHT